MVSYRDWAAIDAAEKRRGVPLGKPREKFVSVPDMLARGGCVDLRLARPVVWNAIMAGWGGSDGGSVC